MILNDGYKMNENLRVTSCPKCGNEQMSEDAEYCRVCGGPLYNLCDGTPVFDDYGNEINRTRHKCHGNSRFCEKCGTKTTFLSLNYLQPFEAVREKYYDDYMRKHPDVTSDEGVVLEDSFDKFYIPQSDADGEDALLF